MSDFDKIINDRLNDDDDDGMENFPRRELNWKRLSNRLAQFEAENSLPSDTQPTTGLHPVWRRIAWLSAAAAVVGVAGFLIWQFKEVDKIKQENAQLRTEMEVLKHTPPAPLKQQPVVRSEAIGEAEIQNPKSKIQNPTPSVSVDKLDKKHREAYEPKSETGNNRPEKEAIGQKPTSDFEEHKPLENKPKALLLEKKETLKLANEKSPNAKTQVQTPPIREIVEETIFAISTPSVLTDTSAKKQNLEKPMENIAEKKEEPKTDTSQTAITEIAGNTEATKMDTAAKAKEIVAQNTEAIAVPSIIPTEKVKSLKWKNKGFSVGLNIVGNRIFPELKGIERSRGIGISAQANLTKQFALTFNADFLNTAFEFHGSKPPPRRPDGRRPWHDSVPRSQRPDFDLKETRGEQKSRFLSVGVRYTKPITSWFEPSVFVGHTWRKAAKFDIEFQFKDKNSEETETAIRSIQTESIANIWQLGLALDFPITKKWTFGVSAEYQKDFSGKTQQDGSRIVADAGILRGGLKYRIF